jgi:hypothetical protein
MDDARDPAALVNAVYEVLSGPANTPKDWERFKRCYAPGAQLKPVHTAPDGRPVLEMLGVEEYIASRRQLLAGQDFYEVEVARRETRYGQLAHVMSIYESRRTPEGEAFARGINSIQLWNDGARWWIISVMWDSTHAARLRPLAELQKL